MKKLFVVILFVVGLFFIGISISADGTNVDHLGSKLDYEDSGFPEWIELDYEDSGFPEWIELDYEDSGFPEWIELDYRLCFPSGRQNYFAKTRFTSPCAT